MVAVVTDQSGVVLRDESRDGGGSNNIAELWAVYLALDWCVHHHIPDVLIYTDSQNNLSWVNGRLGKHLNNRRAVEALQQIIRKRRQRVTTMLKWIPREENLAGHVIEARYGL